jgi:hypothetical protein
MKINGILLIIVEIGTIIYILGWTTAGVAANSIAALIQSSIGPISSGSLFALLQSVGATGLFFKVKAISVLGTAIYSLR